MVPVLLLPGTLCDERLFAPLLAALPAGRDARIIAYTDHADIGAAADAILAAAPAGRFALLGFSLGGIVALEIARRAPGRIAGLALLGATPLPVPPETHADRRAAATGAAPGIYVRDTAWPAYVGADSREDQALLHMIVAMADDLGGAVFTRQIELALTRPDYRPALEALAMPALVLAGAEDAINPPATQQIIADALPDATLRLIPRAGHFALLEQPEATADAVRAWLDRVDAAVGKLPEPANNDQGDRKMSESKGVSASTAGKAPEDDPRAVLQVERRDFTQLVPENRPRVQSLRGFDDCYTDIVDYIVRCTHKIWDERDVGLIYTHYTWNCVAYTTLGTMYDRETHIRDTIQRLVEAPERRGMAQQVLWRGNDVDGFYTSHMTHGIGKHTQFGMFGKPTGRTWLTRTVADCMILENKIYKEWIVRDNMGPLIQLGIDPHGYAETLARKKVDAGEQLMDVLENRRMIGQYPPESDADTSIAHDEGEAQLLRDLHHIYNKRMFGRIEKIYAPNCQWHGPLMREFYGPAAVLQQTMRLVALMPDCSFVPQHICSVENEQGGTKYAVRWLMEGHHLGYGPLGAPTGHPLSVMGISHFHIKDGKIIEEWAVYDELSMLVQVKMAEIQRQQ